MADTEQPTITMEALQAIAQKAEEAAKRAETAAQAGPAARHAAESEGAVQGWTNMPKEMLDGIAAAAAAMTIKGLEERFELQPPAGGADLTGDSSSSSLKDGDDGGSGHAGSTDTDSSASSGADNSPAIKPNFAQKWLGLG